MKPYRYLDTKRKTRMGEVYGWIVGGEMPIQATDGGWDMADWRRHWERQEDMEGACRMCKQGLKDIRHVVPECCVLAQGQS